MAGPQTPVQDYPPQESMRGFSRSSRPSSYVGSNSMPDQPQMAHNPRFREDFDAASRRSSLMLDGAGMQRSASQMSRARSPGPSRSSTLKKKPSLSRKGSLRRNGSRRSMRAGSVRSLSLGDREKYGDGTEDPNSAFTIPIPTSGNPTEVLSNRFQAWRKVLKDLIIFFKEVQKSYETRSKLFLSASHVIGNQAIPPAFLQTGGLADATEILRDFHRQGYTEANKAVQVEMEVISQLTGLRNDLQKKTKEIKSLSGDFKNSVEKELEGTRKSVRHLQESLGLVDTDPSATSGKGDPFIMRLSVERQVEKQIEEENYLHRAYLNLENSGRDLESIVVSEIQKAYNAYASILRREADEAYDTIEKLRVGPISIPPDYEWNSFVAATDELVDPRIPLRNVENIAYPGRDHPAAAEVRAGMLERKSKYLKSYTPGWYVLSPTHLHEFKSADRVAWQTPVMSLYLPEQKLSSHSQPDSSSHKFMLKGRQTGAMHRGHSWVFRAESHETMMSWYEDIESLINKTGEARNAFVRRHVRSVSGMSYSSDGGAMEEDEADRTPYSGSVVLAGERPTSAPRQPGGAFPSDVQIDRHMQAPLSPSSGDGSVDKEGLAAAGGVPDGSAALASSTSQRGVKLNAADGVSPAAANGGESSRAPVERHDSYYGDWIGPAAIAAKQRKHNPADSTVDDREIRSDGGQASLMAAGMVDRPGRRENSAPPQVRRESVSTVPTNTNVTDYTNNTMATSVDEEPSLAHKSMGLEDSALPLRQKTDSMATMDMKIPGRFPPTNVAA
ncbi:hypothetical protein N7474_006517 [Penicillium riverlandense]|uniref:uncharacterized protein n=1 Tax=Penicillium riverlandense TaxID=1903569 RepID=UPI00254925F3|nr:uncharacterized protein N7474_006517 [Penicillium riverlandense]KAJ5814740.1 hypothetical protein N7474_006517 [Penicillium riverlandense]